MEREEFFLLLHVFIVILSFIVMICCKKVSTQNERFLCHYSCVHALTPANSTRSHRPDHEHHPRAHHPVPGAAPLPCQHRLPLGPIQQERHGCRHRGQLEAGLGDQQWSTRFWKGDLPRRLSGASKMLLTRYNIVASSVCMTRHG